MTMLFFSILYLSYVAMPSKADTPTVPVRSISRLQQTQSKDVNLHRYYRAIVNLLQ